MDKLTVMVNATALSHSACLHRFYREVVQGWKARVNSANIEFGSAFHRFRAIYRERGMAGVPDAMHAAQQYLKDTPSVTHKKNLYLASPEYLMRVMSEYAFKYENDNVKPIIVGDESLLEIPFAYPYYGDDEIEIILCGTIDEVATISGKFKCLVDCKTTSSYDEVEYLDSYRLVGQMLFYRRALVHYALNEKDTLLGSAEADNPGILIDGVFCRGQNAVEFHRSNVWIPPQHVIDDYEVVLKNFLNKIIVEFKKNKIPYREGLLNGACTTKFGNCLFFNSCGAPNEQTAEDLLMRALKREEYNPIHFRD